MLTESNLGDVSHSTVTLARWRCPWQPSREPPVLSPDSITPLPSGSPPPSTPRGFAGTVCRGRRYVLQRQVISPGRRSELTSGRPVAISGDCGNAADSWPPVPAQAGPHALTAIPVWLRLRLVNIRRKANSLSNYAVRQLDGVPDSRQVAGRAARRHYHGVSSSQPKSAFEHTLQ